MNEYTLTIYVSENKNRRVTEQLITKFTVNPIKVTSAEERTADGTFKKVVQLNKPNNKSMMEKGIREWLFRKELAPFMVDDKVLWNVAPEFTEEDKQAIMHQYLFNEL